MSEKKEWKNYIGNFVQYGVSNVLIKKILSELELEPDELSDEFKDRVLDIIENGQKKKINMQHISAKEKYSVNPIKWIKDKWNKFKNRNKIEQPSVKIPKIKSPGKPRTYHQDDSGLQLTSLKNSGYTMARFVAGPNACEKCQQMNGTEYTLDELINNSPHNAPLFGRLHCNCKDFYTVYNPDNLELPEINVGPGGRWAYISKKDKFKKGVIINNETPISFEFQCLLEEAKKYNNAEEFIQSLTKEKRLADEVKINEYVLFYAPDRVQESHGMESWYGTEYLNQYNDRSIMGRVIKINPKSIIIKAEDSKNWNYGHIYKIPKDAKATMDLSQFIGKEKEWFIDIYEKATNQFNKKSFLVISKKDELRKIGVLSPKRHIISDSDRKSRQSEKNAIRIDSRGHMLVKNDNYISKKDELNKKGSIIDWPYEDLPHDLWDKKNNSFILKPAIQQEIIKIVNENLKNKFGDEYKEWFKGIVIGSSLASQFFLADADLDIKIIVRNNFNKDVDESIKILRDSEYSIHGHPIDWYIYTESELQQKDFLDKYDSMYDVNGFWLKEPYLISSKEQFPREMIFEKAKQEAIQWAKRTDISLGEIRRHLKEYDAITLHLSILNPKEKEKFKEEINKILLDLEKEIDELIKSKKNLIEERHSAYKQPFQRDLAKYITSLNWTTPNIKFKIIARWNYLGLISAFSKVMEDQHITEDEIPQIKQIIKENYISVKDKLNKQSEKKMIKEIKSLLDRYNECDNEIATVADIVDNVEDLVREKFKDGEDTDADFELQKAIDKFRKEYEYNIKLKGRGDMDTAEQEIMSVLERYTSGLVKEEYISKKDKMKKQGDKK